MRARRGKIPEIDFELGATVEGSSEIGAVRLADGLPDFEGSSERSRAWASLPISFSVPAKSVRVEATMRCSRPRLRSRMARARSNKGRASAGSLDHHHTRKVRQGNRHVGMTRTQRPLPDAHGAPVLTTGRDVITKSGVYDGEVLHHTGDQVGPGCRGASRGFGERARTAPPGCLQISETQVRDCQIAEIAGDLAVRRRRNCVRWAIASASSCSARASALFPRSAVVTARFWGASGPGRGDRDAAGDRPRRAREGTSSMTQRGCLQKPQLEAHEIQRVHSGRMLDVPAVSNRQRASNQRACLLVVPFPLEDVGLQRENLGNVHWARRATLLTQLQAAVDRMQRFVQGTDVDRGARLPLERDCKPCRVSGALALANRHGSLQNGRRRFVIGVLDQGVAQIDETVRNVRVVGTEVLLLQSNDMPRQIDEAFGVATVPQQRFDVQIVGAGGCR